MEEKKPENPLAYPVVTEELTSRYASCPDTMTNNIIGGMTLLDYFAGQALQGNLANPDSGSYQISNIVESSYVIAKLMLKEREKYL